jgi:hypothetical protein
MEPEENALLLREIDIHSRRGIDVLMPWYKRFHRKKKTPHSGAVTKSDSIDNRK